VAASFPIEAYLADVARRVDGRLERLANDLCHGVAPRFAGAIAYALTGGGKRLRPALVLATCDALGGDAGDGGLAMRFALALEMIHTYSLVHDDLPCMDDDDLRRGRPTVHKVYDDATAVLVGDGLQSLAFQHLLAADDPRAPPLVGLLAQGAWRMVEGQALDMAAQGRSLDEGEILALMAAKTGALIRAAVVGGAIAATGSARGLEIVGERLGLAFQIADDVLDLTSDAATLGKTAGKDTKTGKATLPALLGVDAARRRAETACAEAIEVLDTLGDRAAPLRALARFIVTRKR
jgi:farnesyl diphosphate synthase/geranylgeranyl diphosphate synthase type II